MLAKTLAKISVAESILNLIQTSTIRHETINNSPIAKIIKS